MEPPKNPPPTRRYKNEEWEVHRNLIVGIYPLQGMKLKTIKDMLEQDHGFIVNERQLKKKIDDWKIAKNIQSSEMAFIVKKQKQRTMNRTLTHFRVRGQPVEPGKISRWEKRSGKTSEVANSPLPSTPSDISYSPASIRSPSSQLMEMGNHPDMSSTSMMDWSVTTDQLHKSFNAFVAAEAMPHVSTDNGFNVITDSEFNSFEGQSPAPFTPISTPAPSPRMVPAPLGSLTDFGARNQFPSSFQSPSHSEGNDTLQYSDMLPALSTTSLPPDFNVSDKSHTPAAAPRKTRYREAEELELKHRLIQLESKYGSNHPATIDTMARLAAVLQDQGRLRSAEHYNKQVAELCRATFGEDDLRTIEAFLNLLMVLRLQSNFVPAERLCRRLSLKVVTIVPANHPFNLRVSTELGACCHHLGRFPEAEKIYNEVIKLGSHTLQPDDPLLLDPMENLAGLQNMKGDFAGAERTIIAIVDAQRGSRDPNPIEAMNSESFLAAVSASQGRLQESELLARKVLAGQTRTLGAEHRTTLATQTTLAYALMLQAKYDESEHFLQSAYQNLKKTLGGNHILTMKCGCDLVNVMVDQGRFKEAEDNAKELLANATKALGGDHYICNSLSYHLGRSYDGQGRLDEALEKFRKAFEGSARTIGENAPNTMLCKRRIMELEVRISQGSNPGGA
ncbi:hypothetical protein BKA64DRAFT_200253 [Cadophora sp. MPI-SDFR-AT-0126]|nr:hypothetical protein BKA64DRAFT_200253 [Leotiomycetes sp. MPI-SDFR-AT-0126]